MKKILCIASVLALSACSYHYQLTRPGESPGGPTATMIFANQIKVDQIDGKPFHEKFSVWVNGLHTLTLDAGYHTFRFRYSNVGGLGGSYTANDITLGKYLDPGETYKIATIYTHPGTIGFRIEPTAAEKADKMRWQGE